MEPLPGFRTCLIRQVRNQVAVPKCAQGVRPSRFKVLKVCGSRISRCSRCAVLAFQGAQGASESGNYNTIKSTRSPPGHHTWCHQSKQRILIRHLPQLGGHIGTVTWISHLSDQTGAKSSNGSKMCSRCPVFACQGAQGVRFSHFKVLKVCGSRISRCSRCVRVGEL